MGLGLFPKLYVLHKKAKKTKMVLDNKDRPMGPILFPMLILYSSLRKRSVSIMDPYGTL